MAKTATKQYIYIVQSSLESSKCKIGKTNSFERRLKDYNNMTGKSKDNKYKYLFVCEVGDMTPAKYQFLDDAKTLVVSEGYIPNDYKMPFAVSARPILNGLLEKGFKLVQNKEYYPYIKGKKKFAKILVQKS